MKSSLIFSLIFIIASCTTQNKRLSSNASPNILIFVSDDQGYPYASAYGCDFVRTPNFDKIARQGLLFTHFFVDAPQCSPSRASILSGKHIWQLGPAGTHASIFPKGIKVYPDLLRAHGYVTGYCGKGWGPGSWIDGGRSMNPAGPLYQDKEARYKKGPQDKRYATGISSDNYAADFKKFLAQRNNDKPFCFWFGGHEPHRSYEKGSGLRRGKKLSAVDIPAFLPDSKIVRSDFLDYAVEIEWFDMQIGKAMEELKKLNELDNTLIIFLGDNGLPFPRSKAFCFDAGVRTPLAIMWKVGIKKPGRTINDLVSGVDIFPTILEISGVDNPLKNKIGKSLAFFFSNSEERDSRFRDYVFFGRERHSDSRWHNLGYPERAVRSDSFLYIWNLKPERYPAGTPKKVVGDSLVWAYQDIDASPTKDYMIQHRNDLQLKFSIEKQTNRMDHKDDNRNNNMVSLFDLSFGKFPKEMLYNVKNDPYCMHNLADNPNYQERKKHLSEILKQKLKETDDSRLGKTPDIWEGYRRYGPMRKFPEPDWAKNKMLNSSR